VSTSLTALLAIHLAATAAMGGLIWFVQLVHYPLFDAVGEDGFAAYARDHQRRTSWVVGPLMAVEGLSAIALLFVPTDDLPRALPVAGLLLLAVIHASTLWLQVPRHRELAAGPSAAATRRLVASNWVRTIGWSARTVLAVVMLLVAA
jgi:hypothetical protein